MARRRTAKASRAVREVVSSAILLELKDPRIRDVTVIDVDVAPDMRTAKVYVSIMGDDKVVNRCLGALNAARGYLQRRVADRIDTRYTPVLTFILDEGVKKSIEASRILRELAEERGELTPEEDETSDEDEASEENSGF